MTGGWMIGLGLNVVIGAAFLTIGTMLAVQLTRTGQWTTNRIGSLFTLLVLACGVGHGARALLLAAPSLGWFETVGMASRIEFADWHMWVADGVTAAAGVFYVIARTMDKDILQTTRAFEDYRSRRARAIEIHDNVVQELAEAKIALKAGEQATAEAALKRGLRASQAIISRVRQPGADDPESTPDPTTEEVERSDV